MPHKPVRMQKTKYIMNSIIRLALAGRPLWRYGNYLLIGFYYLPVCVKNSSLRLLLLYPFWIRLIDLACWRFFHGVNPTSLFAP
jgi:hypothetical protein